MRVSSDGGFGPVGPTSGQAGPPFAVSGPTDLVIQPSGAGTSSFTVSNVTGRDVRARLSILPGAGADAGWFRVVGEATRSIPVAGTAIVDVAVAVPERTPPGPGTFALGAALDETPEQIVPGPTVGFVVPERTRKPFPWWIVIVIVVALLVLVGGGLLIWNLTRPDPAPSPTPTATRAVFTSGTFTFGSSFTDVDLETGTVTAGIRDGADLSMSDADFSAVSPADRPMDVYGRDTGVAIVPSGDYDTCLTATLGDQVQIPDGAGTTFLCTVTSDDRIALLEITDVPDRPSFRTVAYTVWQ